MLKQKHGMDIISNKGYERKLSGAQKGFPALVSFHMHNNISIHSRIIDTQNCDMQNATKISKEPVKYVLYQTIHNNRDDFV